MTSEYRIARRRVGLPQFEKDCRFTLRKGRSVRAYHVAGTREHGERLNLNRLALQIVADLRDKAEGRL